MDDYQSLSSERKQLEAILAEIPADDVIERASFEARLARIDENLSECGLSFSGHNFRFRDHQQLETAAARVREDNIRESTETVEGVFLGALPRSRRFEFKSLDGGKEIRGRISAEIEAPEQLNDRLNTPMKVTFNVVKVGQGRPKYTLANLDAINAD